MIDVVFLLIFAVIMILAGIFGISLAKKMYWDLPIILGATKKTRAVVKDQRLKPAYWKAQSWLIWLILDVCFAFVFLGYGLARGNWRFVIWVFAFCAAAGAVLAVIWRRARAEFYKQIGELGITPERDPDAVKEASGDISRRYVKKYWPLYMVTAVIFTFGCIVDFTKGNTVQGIMLLVCVLMYTALLVVFVIRGRRGIKTEDKTNVPNS